MKEYKAWAMIVCHVSILAFLSLSCINEDIEFGMDSKAICNEDRAMFQPICQFEQTEHNSMIMAPIINERQGPAPVALSRSSLNERRRLWSEPLLLEQEPGFSSESQVNVDDQGNAFVVWSQHVDTPDGMLSNIMVNRFDPEYGWAGAERIETHGCQSSSPGITVDNQGNAMIIWSKWDGAQVHIFSKRYDKSDGWGPNQNISHISHDVIQTEYPQIMMNDNSNALSIWKTYHSGYYHLIGNRYVHGDGWKDPVTLSLKRTSAYCIPHVGLNGNEIGMAVWVGYDYYNSTHFVSVSRFQRGVWGPVEKITSESCQHGWDPDLAWNDNDTFVITWWGLDHIWFKRWDKSSGWQPSVRLAQNVGLLARPHICLSNNNVVFVCWRSNNSIRVMRYAEDCGWQESLSFSVSSDYAYFDILIYATGSALLMWDDNNIRYSAHYTHVTGWEETQCVAGSLNGYWMKGTPSSMNKYGKAMTVWQSGINRDIYVSVYE